MHDAYADGSAASSPNTVRDAGEEGEDVDDDEKTSSTEEVFQYRAPACTRVSPGLYRAQAYALGNSVILSRFGLVQASRSKDHWRLQQRICTSTLMTFKLTKLLQSICRPAKLCP